ncbi:MAG TPA: hypothetical protein VIL38_03985 [Thermaerobacter sp.]
MAAQGQKPPARACQAPQVSEVPQAPQGAKAPPADQVPDGSPAPEAPAAGQSSPPGWPRWLAAAEDLLVRAVVAGLVALVVVQSLMAGRGPLAYDTYGRVLEDWGYLPATVPLAGTPAGPPAAAGPGIPGETGTVPAPEAGGAGPAPAPDAQTVLTLQGQGPAAAVLLLDGRAIGRLTPGRILPVVIRPGSRLALRVEGGGRATVTLTHVAGPIQAPRPGARWAVAATEMPLEVVWQPAGRED